MRKLNLLLNKLTPSEALLTNALLYLALSFPAGLAVWTIITYPRDMAILSVGVTLGFLGFGALIKGVEYVITYYPYPRLRYFVNSDKAHPLATRSIQPQLRGLTLLDVGGVGFKRAYRSPYLLRTPTPNFQTRYICPFAKLRADFSVQCIVKLVVINDAGQVLKTFKAWYKLEAHVPTLIMPNWLLAISAAKHEAENGYQIALVVDGHPLAVYHLRLSADAPTPSLALALDTHISSHYRHLLQHHE